ncbi:MAG: GntR family transcriptional regulator [Eubacteriaceae bacterium]|nr:GntR family transcriptional regulator [Eubacteriaceae bacterium]
MADNGDIFSSSFSLTDEIVNIIRDRILKGEYKIGEKIKETQIAGELRVSRTPIREAFKQLENEGLIDYIPNRGCFAKGFTKQDIEDLYAVRKALEVLAVEWAVNRIDDKQLKELKEQSDLMEFYTLRNDQKKVLEINADFHNVIYNATGSRFMAQILRSYKDYINQTRKAIFYEEQYLADIYEEHKRILVAVTEKDMEKAKKAMADHLDMSQKRAEMLYNIK